MKMASITNKHFSNHFKNLKDRMSKRHKKTSQFINANKLCHCPWAKLFYISDPNDLEQSACLAALLSALWCFWVGCKQHLLASLKQWGSKMVFSINYLFPISFHSYQSEQIKSKTRLCAVISYATERMGHIGYSPYLLNYMDTHV